MKATMRLAMAASLIIPPVLVAQQPDSAKKADTLAPVTISGSFTTSFTYSNHPVDTTIVGRAYDRFQNMFSLNVVNLTIERVAPTNRVGAGFHAEAWLGQNAAVVKSVGLNLGLDADVWQAYGALNLPVNTHGGYLQLKAGKIATLLGVEVGEDVLNPNLGIGYQDIFLEPFTETGAELDAKVSPKWDAELRLTNGWDQVTDVNKSKTVTARLGLTPDDKTLIALTGYLGPEQPQNNHDNRSGVDLVASRKIISALTAQLQLDYGEEENAAPDGGLATWTAAGGWLTYVFAPTASLAIRGDYMNDRNGARTSGVLGLPVNTGMEVGSVTATANVSYWPHALMRPEIRFDRSSLPVFNGHQSQVSIGIGVSYIY
jgi:hypothetical protein